ncbi:MAG: SsrA-binding protein SmpB [Cyclobacteriaceae bacterium]
MAKQEKAKFSSQISIKNRKARFEYHFLDTYTAGLKLMGTEIKSIREGKVNLQEAYCYFNNQELFVKQMHISPYSQGTHYNHEPTRERKLLLKKKELAKLESKMNEKGLTIIPTRLFINSRGLAKLDIALARGKKLYDKRDGIKQKDAKRELDRMKF